MQDHFGDENVWNVPVRVEIQPRSPGPDFLRDGGGLARACRFLRIGLVSERGRGTAELALLE